MGAVGPGGKTLLLAEIGLRMVSSRPPGKDARCRLYGLPMISGGSSGAGDIPLGGVPAFAVVEFTDRGVLTDKSSSLLRYGDFRVDAGSVSGSAECCRFSYSGVSTSSYARLIVSMYSP